MTITRAVARPMLAGIFVYGGLDALRHPEGKAPKAEKVAPTIAEPLGLPKDTVTLVRINGGVQVVGGTLLAFGKLPRLASLALAGSLVPTTAAGHRFWEESDEGQRSQQQMHFLKNAAILGGLLLAAVDTEGRPSVSWRVRRSVKKARRSAPVRAVAGLTHDANGLTETATRVSRKAAKAGKRAAKSAGAAGGLADEVTAKAVKVSRRAAKSAAKAAAKSAAKSAAKASRAADDLTAKVNKVNKANKGNKATRAAARAAARDAAVTVAGVAAAKSTRRGKRAAAKAAASAADHARHAADRTKDALRDVSLDSARAAASNVVQEARAALPLAG